MTLVLALLREWTGIDDHLGKEPVRKKQKNGDQAADEYIFDGLYFVADLRAAVRADSAERQAKG